MGGAGRGKAGLPYRLLGRLRENSHYFSFTVTGPDGKPVELSDQQILRLTVAGEGGELALPFEVVLPLARPVVVR